MINWQEWVVGVLVVLCIARIIYGIFLFFSQRSAKPCTAVRIRQEPRRRLICRIQRCVRHLFLLIFS